MDDKEFKEYLKMLISMTTDCLLGGISKGAFLQNLVLILKAMQDQPKPPLFPIQDADNIPEWLAKIVYFAYVQKYGDQQSYERMRERGGFGKSEVVWLLTTLDNWVEGRIGDTKRLFDEVDNM